MRQRRIKNLEEKIASVNGNLIEDPAAYKGRWAEAFADRDDDTAKGSAPDASGSSSEADYEVCGASEAAEKRPIIMELGTGKGQFISGMALRAPECDFIGFEGDPSVGYHALKKIEKAGCRNVRMVLGYIHSMYEFFEEDELDGLFLNFSDPWPKKRNAKRRLTYAGRLREYCKVISSGGFIEFRTDNDEFFEYYVDQFADTKELEVTVILRDLHASVEPGSIVTTEYEDKFSEQGKTVNFLQAKVL